LIGGQVPLDDDGTCRDVHVNDGPILRKGRDGEIDLNLTGVDVRTDGVLATRRN